MKVLTAQVEFGEQLLHVKTASEHLTYLIVENFVWFQRGALVKAANWKVWAPVMKKLSCDYVFKFEVPYCFWGPVADYNVLYNLIFDQLQVLCKEFGAFGVLLSFAHPHQTLNVPLVKVIEKHDTLPFFLELNQIIIEQQFDMVGSLIEACHYVVVPSAGTWRTQINKMPQGSVVKYLPQADNSVEQTEDTLSFYARYCVPEKLLLGLSTAGVKMRHQKQQVIDFASIFRSDLMYMRILQFDTVPVRSPDTCQYDESCTLRYFFDDYQVVDRKLRKFVSADEVVGVAIGNLFHDLPPNHPKSIFQQTLHFVRNQLGTSPLRFQMNNTSGNAVEGARQPLKEISNKLPATHEEIFSMD